MKELIKEKAFEEPEIKVFERPEENVIITSSAVELFGDIVEFE